MRSHYKKENSLRKTVIAWLNEHDHEFTTAQLAYWLGRNNKAVSTELCLLKKEGIITEVRDEDGHIKKAHRNASVFKKGTGEVRIYAPKPRSPKKPKLKPGWLGITIHTMENGVERV